MVITEPTLYSIEVTADIALKIRQMAELGVFTTKSGSVELHFDSHGNIAQIVTHTHHKVIPISSSTSIATGV